MAEYIGTHRCWVWVKTPLGYLRMVVNDRYFATLSLGSTISFRGIVDKREVEGDADASFPPREEKSLNTGGYSGDD